MMLSPENVIPPKPAPPPAPDDPPKERPMLTIALLLALAAFVVTIAAAMNRAPLWIAVLLLTLLALLKAIPPF